MILSPLWNPQHRSRCKLSIELIQLAVIAKKVKKLKLVVQIGALNTSEPCNTDLGPFWNYSLRLF